MNNKLANILFKISPLRNFAKKIAQREVYPLARSYAAARNTRFTMDWITERGSINKEIKYAWHNLLERARDLWKNNDYIRGYRSRCRANIVGEGFILQNHALLKDGEEDMVSNQLIEDTFREWCLRENCTMSKQISFLELSWLMIDQWKRDGNILLRIIEGPAADNKFGFAIEPLEIDLLDVDYNTTLPNGNAVIFGIEFNQWRQPVTYYFKSNKIQDEYSKTRLSYDSSKSKPVDASEILHFFDREHHNQFIGVTSLAASMLTFHDMAGYDQAAIINARAGAAKMGFLKSTNPTAAMYRGDDTDDAGDIISNFGLGGEIERLPDGLEFQGWDPKYPDAQYGIFKKDILRRLAVSLGLAYANWVGDLEAVNFSSMRSGLLDERDNWKAQQAQFREGILLPLFSRFLKMAIVSKALPFSYSDYERLNKPNFVGRRWDWVDPRADVEAAKSSVESHLSTLTDELSKSGIDINDYIRTRTKELKLLAPVIELEAKMMGKDINPPVNDNNTDTVTDNNKNYTTSKSKLGFVYESPSKIVLNKEA